MSVLLSLCKKGYGESESLLKNIKEPDIKKDLSYEKTMLTLQKSSDNWSGLYTDIVFK